MSHHALTIHQAREKLRAREVSAIELAQSVANPYPSNR